MPGRAALMAGAAALLSPVAGTAPTPGSAPEPAPAPAPAPTAASRDAGRPFAPPEGPLLLTRTVRRPLPGGHEIRASRSYEVRFVREANGIRLDGTLVEVTMEAPPQLESLAALERRRPDAGMFPMQIDAAGRLLPTGPRPGSDAVRGAMARTSAAVDRARLADFDRQQAQAFVSQIGESGGLNPWPEDLFRPGSAHRRETRTIPLANGARGHVVVDTRARAGEDGMMTSYARTVTSDLAGDNRATYEEWTLAPR